jgi:toxin HigB-1
MEIEFDDGELRRLYEEPEFRLPELGDQLARSYRKVLGLVAAATDERNLRAVRSLHFERLGADRQGQHSMRLHKQWRLKVRFETVEKVKKVVVVEIVDYH